ncbi:PP2C family protein-serine/threonine phosphatase [Candidatus Leptofilum sp.]|uniref:PP2C family protein-serine/threonine phosphatase n=1 Tax=Candidatus Leptofilum sp. TaxID=3241576 RepID=UPI003B5BE301
MVEKWLTQGSKRLVLLFGVLLPTAVALTWLVVGSSQRTVGWWFLLGSALLGGLGALLLIRLCSKRTLHTQQQATERKQLEKLALELLREPLENGDLPALLSRHVPQLFPNGWVEIRLLPDAVLFAQGDGWIPLANERWVELLAELETPKIVAGLPEARLGFGSEALVIPIQGENEENIGGIYLMRAAGLGVRDWLANGRSLAAQIGANLQQVAQLDAALAAQAEAYEKEIYEQAYQAEVNAMMAEYEKVSEELGVARKVQATFLPPELPEIPGWQLAVTLEPAREMSGDFYDFIWLPNGRIGLVIADVADKGMGSALYMALSRTLIRTFAPDFDTEPEQALCAANRRVLTDSSSDLFVTVFYAILDPASGVLTYCNAGHNPPYLYSGNGGGMQPLTRTAIPIGILEEPAWTQGSIQMEPGDLLLMYTDGVTEAEDEDADFFGEARLQAVTEANLGRSVEIIESKVVTAVLDFVGEAPQFDDITLMLLARDS